jgi:antibiotic biosynthesis monooxygenase (ABM) superfamily enzyme
MALLPVAPETLVPTTDRTQNNTDHAVSVVVSRRPVPGHESELVTWAEGISAAASEFPGHVDADIYPPSRPDHEDLVIAFRFADAAALATWEHSAVRREWVTRAQPMVVESSRAYTVTGFESLFDSSINASATIPARWKTATVIALALFPASLLLNWLLVPRLLSWYLVPRVLVTTALLVPFMVWVGVPWLSRWLRPWLAPDAR